MTRKLQTIRSSQEIRGVFRQGFSFSTNKLTVFALKKQDTKTPSRWAIIAPKRVGHAVRRNTAKRKLRVAISSFVNLYIADGFWYVVVAKKPLLDLSHQAMLAHVHDVIQKAQYKACGNEVL